MRTDRKPTTEEIEIARLSPAGLGRLYLPGYVLAPHIEAYMGAVQDAIQTAGRVLADFPPRHGKTSTACLIAAWFLGLNPDRYVMYASYNEDFAAGQGFLVRDILDRFGPEVFGVRVSPRSRSSSSWRLEVPDGDGGWRTAGGMYAVGVGGAATGRGFHLGICDDIVKSAEAAMSRTVRDSTWDWWRSVFSTRAEPGAAIVGIGTRWNFDDWIGRILELEGADRWNVLHFPALAEEDDALGREVGEPLWPSRFDLDALEAQRKSLGPHWWSSLYQGSPVPDGGAIFKKSWLRHYEEPEVGVLDLDGRIVRVNTMRMRFATVDPAASIKTHADPSCLAVWGITSANDLVLLDVVRRRMEAPDLVPTMLDLYRDWRLQGVWIEKTAFQLSLVQHARRARLPVRELLADRDKIARAMLATTTFEAGKVWFPTTAPWLASCITELLTFPAGAHDDFVDATTYAARVWQEATSATTLLVGAKSDRRKPSRYAFLDDGTPLAPGESDAPNDPTGHPLHFDIPGSPF